MAFDPPPVRGEDEVRIGESALPPHFFTMDDDDDDANHHQHPYHQLHHLYAEELHHRGGEEQEENEIEEDEEVGEGDDGEEGEEVDDEDDYEDEDEFEDEDDADQENRDYEQGFNLEQRANNNQMEDNLPRIASKNNGTTSGAPTLSHLDGNTCALGRIDGCGDKHVVRDDWTEAATHTLLEAWGNRYVRLNKGNLKQEDWEDVAEVVTVTSRSYKTDVQCKNRLDTLKKKYKVEKHKQSAIGSSDSKWPFYKQLDKLLSSPAKHAGIPGAVDAGHPVKSALDREGFDREINGGERDISMPPNTSTSSKAKESPDMTFSSPHIPGNDGTSSSRKRKLMDTPFRTLAKAITRFGEIYEKMEHSKQQHLMDLEKIRMEFTRDLELQRMQLFMQTQVELAKMKHGSNDIDTTVSNLSG